MIILTGIIQTECYQTDCCQCYLLKSKAEVDNTDRGLNNSGYLAKTKSIIVLLFISFFNFLLLALKWTQKGALVAILFIYPRICNFMQNTAEISWAPSSNLFELLFLKMKEMGRKISEGQNVGHVHNFPVTILFDNFALFAKLPRLTWL